MASCSTSRRFALRILPLAALAGLFLCASARADTFYVANSGGMTIEKFSAAGADLGAFATTSVTVPTAIAFDSGGNLYVTFDQPNSRIEKFSAAGVDLGAFASTNLTRTYGLVFDRAGNLYAANFGNSTIEKFAADGTDLGVFARAGLIGPVGMVFDGAGNLYVANYGNNTIEKISPAGADLGAFASTGLSVPYALAFDGGGNLYATNTRSQTVEKFSPAGVDLGVFASAGLDSPVGIAFDSGGNCYVANEGSATIHKFSASGADLGVFATGPTGSAPASLAVRAGDASPPPAVPFVTDVNGRQFAAGSMVTLTAAADFASLKDIARVDFYADGAIFASFDGAGNPIASASSPGSGAVRRAASQDAVGGVFQAAFQVPNVSKLVSLFVMAINKLGQSQMSPVVTIQAVAGAADRPPKVALGGDLKNHARVHAGATFTVPVSVSDPDAGTTSAATGQRRPVRRAFETSAVIARIEYYINQLKVKDSAEAPFTFDFTPASAGGAYVLTAIATDGAGLATVSDPVTVFTVPTVSLSVLGDGIAQEGGKKAKVLFTRSGNTDSDLTVLYKTKGTGKSGVDYEALSGTLVIPAGAQSFKLKIKPIDDAVNKGTRKVNIQLLASPAGDYDLGDVVKAKTLLLDND